MPAEGLCASQPTPALANQERNADQQQIWEESVKDHEWRAEHSANEAAKYGKRRGDHNGRYHEGPPSALAPSEQTLNQQSDQDAANEEEQKPDPHGQGHLDHSPRTLPFRSGPNSHEDQRDLDNTEDDAKGHWNAPVSPASAGTPGIRFERECTGRVRC